MRGYFGAGVVYLPGLLLPWDYTLWTRSPIVHDKGW